MSPHETSRTPEKVRSIEDRILKAADKYELLTVETESFDGDTRKRSSVKMYADAIAYLDPETSYSRVSRLMAMSIIGPEQAVRAIAAGCSLKHEHTRTHLTFRSRAAMVECRWSWGWRCIESRLLAPGAMHMVAIAESAEIGSVKTTAHFIVPQKPTESSLREAIYDCLGDKFSTPLLPCGKVGQPPEDRDAAEHWRKEITGAVLANPEFWRSSKIHPDQPDRTWAMCGVLAMDQDDLDTMVSNMVKSGRIRIPEKLKRSA